MGEPRDRRRLSEMLEPLATGEELARRRVWNRVQSGVEAGRRQARRNRWMLGGSGVAAAAAAVLFVTAVMGGGGGQTADPWNATHERVALGAVLEMLGQPSGDLSDEQAMEQFVRYLVTEAQATPQ